MLTDFAYSDLCSRRDRAFATYMGASALLMPALDSLSPEAAAEALAQLGDLRKERDTLNEAQRAAFAARIEAQRAGLSRLAA